MLDFTSIKKTFGIYEKQNKFYVQLQVKNITYRKSFEKENECITYIKDKIGDAEYNKRQFEAFNYNFKKYIVDNNILEGKYNKIWEMICKRYIGAGHDKSRGSHIEKIKELTLSDIFCQLKKQKWKCYYSDLEFNTDIEYMRPSIDRIDSNKFYNKDNCVIVIEFCQYLKNAYSIEEFKRCIRSISTGVLDERETSINTLIGGGKKNGLKKYKQIDLNIPIKMSKIQYYIYNILKNECLYIDIKEIYHKIKKEFEIDPSKAGLRNALNKMIDRKYILIYKTDKSNSFKYKLADIDNIRKVNNDITICCGSCGIDLNISEFRSRNCRGKNKYLNLNIYHTVCRTCNTNSTNKYKNKNLQTFILRQISGRTDKKGNITKENFHHIKGSNGKCAVSGIQLIAKNNSGMFNQASPDRLDNKRNYDINNVQIVCLAINFAKKNYIDITNDTIIFIINSIFKNIQNY